MTFNAKIDSLLKDETVSEIMVNSWDQIFIECEGKIFNSEIIFDNAFELSQYLHQFIQEHHPEEGDQIHFDGILPDGSRYNITLAPLSPKSPTITIRKFRTKICSFDDLVRYNSLSAKAARFLDVAVKSRLSIIISGGTGTGKTTLLNTIASSIPPSQRVVSIEDIPELQLPLSNWIQLVAVRKPVAVSTRECLINALRMRPDRIVVGECRKDETFEMLQAMNTGHEGSMTTVHANSAQDAMTRIESLILYSKFEIPIKTLRYQMSEAIDLIVQLRRSHNGKREVSEIIELTGMEGDIITRAPIFQRDKLGNLVTTGYIPECLKKINAATQMMPEVFFTKDIVRTSAG